MSEPQPTVPVEPLTAEEEALFREGLRDAPTVRALRPFATSLSSITIAEWADRCRRLLATLDAERAARPSAAEPPVADLRATAERVVEVWEQYTEAHAERHHGPHVPEMTLDGACGKCAGAQYGTEVEMGEYAMPALAAALRDPARHAPSRPAAPELQAPLDARAFARWFLTKPVDARLRFIEAAFPLAEDRAWLAALASSTEDPA